LGSELLGHTSDIPNFISLEGFGTWRLAQAGAKEQDCEARIAVAARDVRA